MRCGDGPTRAPFQSVWDEFLDPDRDGGAETVLPEHPVTRTSIPPKGSCEGVGWVIAWSIRTLISLLSRTSDGPTRALLQFLDLTTPHSDNIYYYYLKSSNFLGPIASVD